MRKIIVLGLLIAIGWHAPGFGEQPTAQKYFDQATTQYLVGDLKAALNSVDRALEISRNFRGARKLKDSILREMKLREMGLVPRAAGTPIKMPPIEVAPPATREVQPPAAPAASPKPAPTNWLVWTGFILGLAFILFSGIFLAVFVRRLLIQEAENKAGEEEAGGLKVLKAISEDQRLWYQKMGWHNNPFTLDVHPELLTGYEKEVKEVLGKVNSHSGHILITGPLGIGKTTLLRWLAGKLPKADYHTVYIPRPPIEFNQLVAHIFQSLGYSYEQAKKESDLYNLGQLRKKMKKYLVLLLDEAHEFTIEIERPLRTLGDIDGVNLVMAGLPETLDKLRNEIQPLYERLVLKITLDHLEFEEFKELIKVRVESVGGRGSRPFTAAALEKIFEISRGNPRQAIKLCDNAVSEAIEQCVEIIGPELIKDTERESADVD
ncbi:MAG: ATP-binding protein [Candidatus Margulisbacteria bacterium]|nr:ATP-binding protein [Candidatus Margulisiibacteriota bacterium]